MQMYWFGPHLGGWGWAFGLGSVVFWVLVVVAIVALVRSFTRGGQRPLPPFQGYGGPSGPYAQPGPSPRHYPTPDQILAERFARGEIDEAEYRQRLATLRGEAAAHGPGAPPPGPTATPS
jgi:putative membrane protein